MDPIRHSRGSLQTPTNQLSSSDRSKLPQGVKEPIQTMSLPKHSTPLQTLVTSLDTQRQPGQMSQSLFGAWQQVDPWLHELGLGISSDSSPPTQNSLHEMLQLSEQFKDMTTEPSKRTISVRTHGRKLMCSKYLRETRLETIPEVEQNITNESNNLVSGKTCGPLSIGSVRERRIADVRYRYGKLLPKSLSRRSIGEINSTRCSKIDDFGHFQVPENQPGSSGLFEFPQGVREPRATQLQPIHFTQLIQTPMAIVDNLQRPPRQMSPPLSRAWQQSAPWLLGPRLGISNDSSRSIQKPLQEMQRTTENSNNMTTEDDIIMS